MTLSSHTGRGVAWMAGGETARQITHLIVAILQRGWFPLPRLTFHRTYAIGSAN